jgi:hypothetical protein
MQKQPTTGAGHILAVCLLTLRRQNGRVYGSKFPKLLQHLVSNVSDDLIVFQHYAPFGAAFACAFLLRAFADAAAAFRARGEVESFGCPLHARGNAACLIEGNLLARRALSLVVTRRP